LDKAIHWAWVRRSFRPIDTVTRSEIDSESVPFGPINNIQETFEHPQAIARGAIIEIDVSFM
jgi:crotonobetainyl-CoA:carnitine CoA-transferase CaiB-like acyl-CoA transferase